MRYFRYSKMVNIKNRSFFDARPFIPVEWEKKEAVVS
jgi:hypothetical protein